MNYLSTLLSLFLLIHFNGLFAQPSVNNILAELYPSTTVTKEYITKTTIDDKFYFTLRSAQATPVKKETIDNANSLSDFLEEYPVNWIKNYQSVTLFNGPEKAVGKSEQLTEEQKTLLKNANIDDLLYLEVNYAIENTVTNNMDDFSMKTHLHVHPKIQAEFDESNGHFKQYIKSKLEAFLNTHSSITIQRDGELNFVVNEDGSLSDFHINKSFGTEEVNAFIIGMMQEMPTWIPAETADGKKVKQQLQLIYGSIGC